MGMHHTTVIALTWPEEGDMKVEMMSTGTGNTIVELFSAEMLVRVCR